MKTLHFQIIWDDRFPQSTPFNQKVEAVKTALNSIPGLLSFQIGNPYDLFFEGNEKSKQVRANVYVPLTKKGLKQAVMGAVNDAIGGVYYRTI